MAAVETCKNCQNIATMEIAAVEKNSTTNPQRKWQRGRKIRKCTLSASPVEKFDTQHQAAEANYAPQSLPADSSIPSAFLFPSFAFFSISASSNSACFILATCSTHEYTKKRTRTTMKSSQHFFIALSPSPGSRALSEIFLSVLDLALVSSAKLMRPSLFLSHLCRTRC